MGFTQGLRAGIATMTRSSSRPPARTLEASAFMGPAVTSIGSPWADRSTLTTITLQDIFGTTDPDAQPVTRAEAMAVPAVKRARGMVCNTLARLQLVGVDTATGDQLDPAHQTAQLLGLPDPGQNPFVLLTWTFDDLMFYGVSWWVVTSRYAPSNAGGIGYPRTVRRVLPGNVVLEDGGTVKVYGKDTDPADVIRIDGPDEGILTTSGDVIRRASQLERSAAAFARQPIPAIELHNTDDTPMSRAEVTQLVTDWVNARKGTNGGVAYTPRQIETKVLGAPAENLLTAGRNAAAIDCARVVGAPADAIDASVEHASMTYQTSEGRNRVLIDYGLAAYGAALTSRLSMPDITPRGIAVTLRYEQITEATNATEGDSAPEPTTPGA